MVGQQHTRKIEKRACPLDGDKALLLHSTAGQRTPAPSMRSFVDVSMADRDVENYGSPALR